jgi:glycosyltransferase involved in cell wall biosynthesis
MRILYHHRTLGDGAEGVHIEEMVEAFVALGHEVRIQAPSPPPVRRGESRPSTLKRIKAWLPQGLFEIGSMGYNVLDFVTTRRALRQWRADLLYKRHALFDVGAIFAARSAGVPVVLEVNAAYSSKAYQALDGICFGRLARLWERASIRCATIVVAVSSPLRDLLVSVASGSNHIMVLPNGANPSRFTPAAQGSAELRPVLGAAPDSILVGWCGIMRDWHGLELLLTAAQHAPGVRLAIVGDGPERARVEQITQELGLQTRTVFTGRIPHDEMPKYVAAMDIAVAANDRTGYASPMKVLEYLAAGRPVVVPRLAGIEDIIKDGVNGIFFTANDPCSLAAALTRLAADAGLRDRLGRAGRMTVERERNWQRNAETVIKAVQGRAATGHTVPLAGSGAAPGAQ